MQTVARHRSASDLNGQIIDGHSHAGVSLVHYARMDYPYAQTIEGLYAQQLQGGVDVNIVFPFTADLYFDLPSMLTGTYRKGRRAVSSIPYDIENQLLLREVFDYCPERSARFLPFVSADPARAVREQVQSIEALMRRYAVYGLKINPSVCQSPVQALLTAGRPLLALAREHNLPVLLHTTTVANDAFSHAREAFRVIDAHPGIRFCLAHCILFSRTFLDRALQTPNVWIDTAAFTIQVAFCRDLTGTLVDRDDRIDADFESVDRVFETMCDRYGERLIWGSDSPAFAYCSRRKDDGSTWQEFNYKATYADEVRLLRHCAESLRNQIAGRNTVHFLMGDDSLTSC